MLRGLAIIIHKCYTYYIVKNKLVINHQQAIDQLLDIIFFIYTIVVSPRLVS